MPFWFSAESRVLFAAVIALSVIVFFSLSVNGILIWRLRRAEPYKRTTIVNSSIPVPSGVHQASEPGVYMELQPRPSDLLLPVTGRQTSDPSSLWKCGVKCVSSTWKKVRILDIAHHINNTRFWLCDIFFINSVDNTKLPWCYILFVAVLYCCYITTRVNFFSQFEMKMISFDATNTILTESAGVI